MLGKGGMAGLMQQAQRMQECRGAVLGEICRVGDAGEHGAVLWNSDRVSGTLPRGMRDRQRVAKVSDNETSRPGLDAHQDVRDQARPTAISSQPNGVVVAVSPARSSTVVVPDSTIAGPAMRCSAASASKS